MANEENLALLKQGTKIWCGWWRWRTSRRGIASMATAARVSLSALLVLLCVQRVHAEPAPLPTKPRLRVIVDNDFGGDPDGLFQLAHQLLSSSTEVVGVIASQHYKNGFYGLPGDVEYSKATVGELLKVLKRSDDVRLVSGLPGSLHD